jgi:hypothetical protein
MKVKCGLVAFALVFAIFNGSGRIDAGKAVQ